MDINSILNGEYDRVELIKAKMIKPDIDLVYELKVSRESKIVFMDWHIFKKDVYKRQAKGYDVTDLSGLDNGVKSYYFIKDPDGYKIEIIRLK